MGLGREWDDLATRVEAAVGADDYDAAVSSIEDHFIEKLLTATVDLRKIQAAARMLYLRKGQFRVAELADQNAAIDFYTNKLGFELVEDRPFGESRWVTIALPNQRDLTLALELATTAEDRAHVGRQAGGHAFLGLDAPDCLADFRRMQLLGVKFLGEPQSGPWGTGVQLEDLYGNKLFLSQEP